MKLANTIIKLAAAAAAVAGIAYLVVRYFDDIKAWLARYFPCCDYALEDEDLDFDFPGEQAPAAEAPAPEAAPAEEAPAEEAAPAEDEAVPAAEEEDFEA